MNKKLIFTLVAASLSTSAFAEGINLSPVVVTATRSAQNSFDLPVSIDVVDQRNIKEGQLQMTLSESLIRVPGITAQNRNQQAQDPQLSTRGFGSRSSFGVRGIRLYVDGIPLTMPDGQGQPGIVDLSAIKSIEVMRGPFSSLYGNSSGGVIQMISQDAPKTPEVGASVMYGSYGTKREVLNAAGTEGIFEYNLNLSNFDTDGYRDYSSSSKKQATVKFKFNFSESTKLTTLINWFDQTAQDPLGLTSASAFTSPRSVVDAVKNANTRVSRDHTQVGINFEHAFNDSNSIHIMAYGGNRNNLQILATNSGGTNARASQIARDFYGTDLRWDNKGAIFSKPYTLSFGVNYGESKDARLDTNVLLGSVLLTPPTLNRDEDNNSKNFDQYAQAKLAILDNVDLHAGLRRTKVDLVVKDKFTSGNSNNGDNSGSVSYSKTTPVIGATWKVLPALNLYANYGEGFETPTFIEAAYTDTVAGKYVPNLTLKPSESKNYEVGAKAFIGDNTRVNLTLFKTDTENELVLAKTDTFNRAIYTNANKTGRSGVEMSVDSQLRNNFGLYGAYTLLDAKFDSSSANIKAGNVIPGTYRTQIYGEASWKAPSLGFSTAIEGRYNSKVYVNDGNTESAPAYTIFNVRAGFQQNVNNWRFSEYLRVENVFDKDYIGSTRVNDGNSRFYEPAAGRNYMVGVSASYRF
ncbi:MAG: TonB-dependent receptor [Burkholderiaceae bacterium]|nr:TonB-dependent receptor [Burkholderiaceae bacterium]